MAVALAVAVDQAGWVVAGNANAAQAGRAAAAPVVPWAKAARAVAEAGGQEVAAQGVRVDKINMDINNFALFAQDRQ